MTSRFQKILFYTLINSTMAIGAEAQSSEDCVGPDHGSYSSEAIDLSFDSRVENPLGAGRRFSFVRCIMSNNRQYFHASWDAVDMVGVVEYDRPLRSSLPFLSGEFVEVVSTISLELNSKRDWFQAPVILSARENTGEWTIAPQVENSGVRAFLDQATESARSEEERAALGLVSVSSFGFQHPLLETPVFIEVTVSSQFPSRDDELVYGADYSISASLSSEIESGLFVSALEQIPIFIRPRGIREIVEWYNDDRVMRLSELLNGEAVLVPSSPISADSLYPVETSFSLVSEGDEIARFPVIIYGDYNYIIQ